MHLWLLSTFVVREMEGEVQKRVVQGRQATVTLEMIARGSCISGNLRRGLSTYGV